jgi:hypothetical protein
VFDRYNTFSPEGRRTTTLAPALDALLRVSKSIGMNNVILYLIGFAGTGKLTIAQAIMARAPFLLVDNHSINNVVFRLIDTDGISPLPPSVWEHVRKIRAVVFDTMRSLSKPEHNFVLTNELVEGKEDDERVFHEVRDLATARGAHFLPVRLLITPEELARRAVSPQRQVLLKSRDPDAAWRIAREHQVYRPKDVEHLTLEVTTLAPAEAAERILAAAQQRFAP